MEEKFKKYIDAKKDWESLVEEKVGELNDFLKYLDFISKEDGSIITSFKFDEMTGNIIFDC